LKRTDGRRGDADMSTGSAIGITIALVLVASPPAGA
jgi:hypothetical protein